ncbi:MAG: molecular chaperone [Rhodospirillales bacterium]|nr:molecular chaperone [Rhodospirillales bacterium]
MKKMKIPFLKKTSDDVCRGRSMYLRGLAAFLFVVIVAGAAMDAHAIRISMKRVVFTDKNRSEVITIINNTAEEQVYRLEWRRMRMTEDKSLKAVEKDDPADDIKWADDMIRFAPRRVTVPAGATQQIRLLLRKPKDLAPGEYRSHLWIMTESVPENFKADPMDMKEKQAIKLAMLPGISMPVFVRTGDLKASVSFSDVSAKATAEGAEVNFTLNRTGNRSTYGDLDFVCIGGGEEIVAHQVRGIAIYTDVERRIMKFKVEYPEASKGSCSKMHVTYRADEDDELFRGSVMAETDVTVSP